MKSDLLRSLIYSLGNLFNADMTSADLSFLIKSAITTMPPIRNKCLFPEVICKQHTGMISEKNNINLSQENF
jgi:hypothetical protein